MTYWVYQNWTAEKKGVIHAGECPFCKEGKGIHPVKTDKRNGTWHGPFDSYETAKKRADELHTNVSDCRKCIG